MNGQPWKVGFVPESKQLKTSRLRAIGLWGSRDFDFPWLYSKRECTGHFDVYVQSHHTIEESWLRQEKAQYVWSKESGPSMTPVWPMHQAATCIAGGKACSLPSYHPTVSRLHLLPPRPGPHPETKCFTATARFGDGRARCHLGLHRTLLPQGGN